LTTEDTEGTEGTEDGVSDLTPSSVPSVVNAALIRRAETQSARDDTSRLTFA